jgi:MFS family permease
MVTQVVKTHLDLSSIGFVFAWYCLVMTLCSALLGRLSDTVGRRLFLVVGVVCHVPFYLLFGLLWPSAWVPEDVLSHNPLTVYASVTLLGVGDSCFTTLPPILMSVFFTDNTGACALCAIVPRVVSCRLACVVSVCGG